MVGVHAQEPDAVLIGMETDRGLFVGTLVAAGYQVFTVNPMSTSRFRDRHSTSGRSPVPAMPRCWPGRAPCATTAGLLEKPTTQRYATLGIDWSASSMAASPAAPPTRRKPPGATEQQSSSHESLDKLGAWDI